MGSFTPSLVVSRVAVCVSPSACPVRAGEPRRRVHLARARGDPRSVPACSARIGSLTSRVLPQNACWFCGQIKRHHHRIDHAGAVLGVVNALRSASTRPWPGLRALTTPARGTAGQLRDGGRSDEAHNDVDDDIAQAYVGLIPSVPHGTPPVRHNGLRSAHSADRPKGTVWSASLTTSQPVAGLLISG